MRSLRCQVQQKYIANEEGDIVDEEMAILNPENANIIPDTEKTVGDNTYRNIDVEEDESLQAKVQGLDKEQRAVIDDLVGYAIKYKLYEERKTENPKPAPPFMLVY